MADLSIQGGMIGIMQSAASGISRYAFHKKSAERFELEKQREGRLAKSAAAGDELTKAQASLTRAEASSTRANTKISKQQAAAEAEQRAIDALKAEQDKADAEKAKHDAFKKMFLEGVYTK